VKMIQGVRDVFEIVDMDVEGFASGFGGRSGRGTTTGKLVLIGRGMDEGAYGESIRWQLEIQRENERSDESRALW